MISISPVCPPSLRPISGKWCCFPQRRLRFFIGSVSSPTFFPPHRRIFPRPTAYPPMSRQPATGLAQSIPVAGFVSASPVLRYCVGDPLLPLKRSKTTMYPHLVTVIKMSIIITIVITIISRHHHHQHHHNIHRRTLQGNGVVA